MPRGPNGSAHPAKRVLDPHFYDNERPQVEHKNFHPWVYEKPFMLFVLLSGYSLAFYLLSFFTGGRIALLLYVLILAFFGLKLWKMVHNCRKRVEEATVGNEFHDLPNVKELSVYKDAKLLHEAWIRSPYRAALLDAASAAGEDITKPDPSWDKPETVIFYQPKEGWCGHGTLNTCLRRLPGCAVEPCPRMMSPFSASALADFISSKVVPREPRIKKVEAIEVDGEKVTLAEFIALMKDANKRDVLVAINFLRAPLFFPDAKGDWNRCWKRLGGHFSPIGGFLEASDIAASADESKGDASATAAAVGKGLVMVLDVNQSYGPYMIPVERLYEACRTRDSSSMKFRGVLRMEVDLTKQRRTNNSVAGSDSNSSSSNDSSSSSSKKKSN